MSNFQGLFMMLKCDLLSLRLQPNNYVLSSSFNELSIQYQGDSNVQYHQKYNNQIDFFDRILTL